MDAGLELNLIMVFVLPVFHMIVITYIFFLLNTGRLMMLIETYLYKAMITASLNRVTKWMWLREYMLCYASDGLPSLLPAAILRRPRLALLLLLLPAKCLLLQLARVRMRT
jgi:hypothetical protein